MDEHKKYLADRILSEERPITYRLLSRALDVHVNTAKEMLYDFHQYQNGLRADSVHATYLVYGTKGREGAQHDGDVEMTSSMPEQEAFSEDAPTTTLTIVAEEKLDEILAEYKEVTSLHVYSLAPHPQRDLAMLSDMSLSEYSAKEDPTATANKYGTIVNPQVRRRIRPGKAKAPAASSSSSKPVVKEEPAPVKPAPAANVKQEAAEPSSKTTTPASSTGKSSAPPLKRGGSGSIMQSFAKASAKPPKPKPDPKKEDNSAMALSDDGEADDSDMPAAKKPPAETEASRKSRKEREDELRRMMEEDDDDDDVDEEPDEKEDEPADEEMQEDAETEQKTEEAAPSESKEDKEPAEMVSSTGDGRRRGKRRVMKKKRILDDQGYMVTIQEPAWESFSEDEAPPPAKKPTPAPTPASSNSKAKKPAGKSGQGNIMSFFSKK